MWCQAMAGPMKAPRCASLRAAKKPGKRRVSGKRQLNHWFSTCTTHQGRKRAVQSSSGSGVTTALSAGAPEPAWSTVSKVVLWDAKVRVKGLTLRSVAGSPGLPSNKASQRVEAPNR